MNQKQPCFSDGMPARCPACGSDRIARILWGLPVYSQELQEQMDAGKVVLGGCCVSDFDPCRTCLGCGADIYKETLRGKVGREGDFHRPAG